MRVISEVSLNSSMKNLIDLYYIRIEMYNIILYHITISIY